MQIGQGFERLLFFIFSSCLLLHIFACLWVFFSQLAPDDEPRWLDDDSIKNLSYGEIYLSSIYFTITTFSTVGYGDISGNNNYEKIFCIFIMMIGVTAFAAGTSFLTNLLQNYDQENGHLQEKVMKLDKIYKEYKLPLKLYENVKRSLCYQYSNDYDDLQEFIETLPQDLRLEVSLFVFEKTFKQIHYLKNRPISFIAWICPLLKP